MGNSLEQHRASIGAFNTSSKRNKRIFSSRSSKLVSIVAPIHLQLLLFGDLGLLNSELLPTIVLKSNRYTKTPPGVLRFSTICWLDPLVGFLTTRFEIQPLPKNWPHHTKSLFKHQFPQHTISPIFARKRILLELTKMQGKINKALRVLKVRVKYILWLKKSSYCC